MSSWELLQAVPPLELIRANQHTCDSKKKLRIAFRSLHKLQQTFFWAMDAKVKICSFVANTR